MDVLRVAFMCHITRCRISNVLVQVLVGSQFAKVLGLSHAHAIEDGFSYGSMDRGVSKRLGTSGTLFSLHLSLPRSLCLGSSLAFLVHVYLCNLRVEAPIYRTIGFVRSLNAFNLCFSVRLPLTTTTIWDILLFTSFIADAADPTFIE
jgi:hypothetical protein